MDPFVLGLLSWILKTARDGIAGNRVDAAAVTGWNTGIRKFSDWAKGIGLPENRDLQIAVYRSFLLAQTRLVQECLDELTGGTYGGFLGLSPYVSLQKDRKSEVDLLIKNKKQLSKHLKQIKNQGDQSTLSITLPNFEELVSLQTTTPSKNFEASLNTYIKKNSESLLYQTKATSEGSGLLDYIREFFSNELRTNSTVQEIFQQQILVQIKSELNDLQGRNISIERILQEIHKASQERGAPFSQNSNRKSWLELQLQKSKARCIARWQGIGVSEQTAISLAEDLSVGTPEFNQEVLSRKLTLLIGEIGVGKSLIGDRLFQTSILRAQSDINSPTPIYLKADQVRVFQSLEKAMQESISELNFPEIGNIYLIIDEVDDLGLSDARNLLKEAREIIQSEPKINILMISKPIIDFSYAQESIAIERLPREKSTELIKRVSENQNFSPDNLPEPIKEAILTPLFAVLLGTYLKRGRTSAPRTKLQLLSDLVKSSLKDMEDNLLEIDALLTRFAAACIDKGGVEISESEVGSWADQQKLIRSNLITNESGNFRFPLPILTYWFAAQNFLSDNDFISNIVADYRRLERWRYPLVIASSTFSPAQVNKILTPIAEQQPSIAADIVAEALSLSNRLPHFPNQTASGVGCNIRIAMQAWVKGFSPYSQCNRPRKLNNT